MLEHTEQMDQAILNSDPIVTCEPEAPETSVDYELSQEISTPNFNDSLDSYTREINQSNYYTNIDLPTSSKFCPLVPQQEQSTPECTHYLQSLIDLLLFPLHLIL